MWDDAPLLRSLADVLFSLSVSALLYGAIHHAVHRPDMLPLHSAHLQDAPQRMDVRTLRQALRESGGGNFFTVDIERLRQSLERLPWVRRVDIRREFPDRLALDIEEHQPLARWNRSALVNTHGEVFAAECERVTPEASGAHRPPPCGGSAQPLPDFIGQVEDAGEIAQRYAQFQDRLGALKLRVAQVALTPRHAWQLRLDNGMVLELGKEDVPQRLARFVAGYPYSQAAWAQQAESGRSAKYVDLRYRNGFAIRG